MKLNAEDVAPQDGNPRGKQLELFTHTKGNIAGVSPNNSECIQVIANQSTANKHRLSADV